MPKIGNFCVCVQNGPLFRVYNSAKIPVLGHLNYQESGIKDITVMQQNYKFNKNKVIIKLIKGIKIF